MTLDAELRDAHRPCPWSVCQCTHTGECEAGWIDRGDYVAPCPQCRPEVAVHLRQPGKSMRRKRAELPTLPRPSRNPHGAW